MKGFLPSAVVCLGLMTLSFGAKAQWGFTAPPNSGNQFVDGNVGIGYFPTSSSAPYRLNVFGDAGISGGNSMLNRTLYVDNMELFTLKGGTDEVGYFTTTPFGFSNGTSIKIAAGSGNSPLGINSVLGGNIFLEPGTGVNVNSTTSYNGNIIANEVAGSFLIGNRLGENYNRLIVGTGVNSLLNGARNNIGQWESGRFGESGKDDDLWSTLGGAGNDKFRYDRYGLLLNAGQQAIDIHVRKRNAGSITGIGDAYFQWSDNTDPGLKPGAADLIFKYQYGSSAAIVEREVMRLAGENGRISVNKNGATAEARLDVEEAAQSQTEPSIAVKATITGTNTTANRSAAIVGRTETDDVINVAVQGDAVGNITRPDAINVGVLGRVNNTILHLKQIAVFGNAFGVDTRQVDGKPYGNDDNLAVVTGGPYGERSLAGYFNGATAITVGNFITSDQSFKTNIESLTGALRLLEQLKPRTYDYKQTKEYAHIALPRDKGSVGFVAQELQKVLPNLVRPVFHPAEYDTAGKQIAPTIDYLAVNYAGLTPYLVAGIQELKKELDELRQEREQRTVASTTNSLPNVLKDGLELEQSVPNPTPGRATIAYKIPGKAAGTLMVLELNGRIIREINLEGGLEQVEVDLSDKPAGMYIYTLVAAGYKPVSKTLVVR